MTADHLRRPAPAVTVLDAGRPAPGDLASIRQRGDAAATSAARIVLWVFACGFLFCAVGAGLPSARSPGPLQHIADAWLIFLTYIFPLLVNAIYSARYGGTFGMVKYGIGYARHPGGQTSRFRCFVRTFAGILCMPLLPISLLTMYVDAHRRSLADLLCGTTVRVGTWDRPSRVKGFPHFGRDTSADGIDESPYCARCGYSLRGLQTPRCPECGTPFRPVPRETGM
jgi:uncharacterized RDD family membrane protein YckC